jgi:hypothetical protein
MNRLIHLVGVSLILLSTQSALGEAVMPVSPGGWERVLAIGDPCPTFSWSRDAAAVDYQLAVFLEGPGEAELSAEPQAIEPLRYAERLAQSEPAIRQQISGAALSWTPGAGNCLAPGLYGWYARGLDESGLGEWSQARYFRVDPRVAAALSAPALGAMQDLGLLGEAGEGAPSWVFHPATFDGIEGSGGALAPDAFGLPSAGLAQSGIIAPEAEEGDAQYNTYFGTGAGASLDGSGYYNSFFGYEAGNNTTGGDSNTFSGYQSGYSNTTGTANTFSGVGSGYNNTTGSYNTFLGYGSGHNNATGDSNVFLGLRAGYFETGSNKLYIENSLSSAPLIYGDFGSDILAVNGRLGVGTEAPEATAKIHTVADTTGPVDGIILENEGGPARLVLINDTITNSATQDQKWIINSNGTLRLSAGSDGAEFKLDAGGNLTVSGSYRVNGEELDVPDYVFEPHYPLRPLGELQRFIEANRHLPDMPSAAEVGEQGLDMTKMQIALLRKVEELTLYTVRQQDTIDKQQKTIEQQRQSYEKLQDALVQQRKLFEERLAALEMAVR